MENLEDIEVMFQNGNKLFENQNYSEALKVYRKIKHEYSEALPKNSKVELEITIVKTLMKIYHNFVSNNIKENTEILIEEISRSINFINKIDPDNRDLQYIKIEFKILLKEFDTALKLLEEHSEKIGQTLDILLLYVIIYNKKNNVAECEKYFKLLDKIISPKYSVERFKTILVQKSGLTIENINHEMEQLKENIKMKKEPKIKNYSNYGDNILTHGRFFTRTDNINDYFLISVIADNYGINIYDYLNLDYMAPDSLQDVEFLKNNRELIIEQKSLLCIKKGNEVEILDKYFAIDMIQNEKYLEYNWIITKAMTKHEYYSDNHYALSMIKWLFSKNFFNSKYHELLISSLTSTYHALKKSKELVDYPEHNESTIDIDQHEYEKAIKIMPNPEEYKILINTAKKWKYVFSKQISNAKLEKNYEDEPTDDKKLMQYINDNSSELKELVINMSFSRDLNGEDNPYGYENRYGKISNYFADSIIDEIKEIEKSRFL